MLIQDKKEREAALDTSQSFIVQAPAGSGKTGLLTQRLLALLLIVRKPEEVLSITFTKKAANEMTERVMLALQRAKDESLPSDSFDAKTWQLARQVLAQDKALSWDLIENPNRLKIQTIDAFSASIARQLPIISQLGTLPKVNESPRELYEMAAKNLLKALETNDPWSLSVQILLKHLDNNLALAQRLLADMLSHRDQWLPYIGKHLSKKTARTVLEAGLKNVISETLATLTSQLPKNLERLLILAKFAADNLAVLGDNNYISACTALGEDWPGASLEDFAKWRGIAELLLTQEGAFRKTVTLKQGFPAKTSVDNKSDKAYLESMKKEMLGILEE